MRFAPAVVSTALYYLFAGAAQGADAPLVLSKADYQDRVHAAWLGQIVGVLTTLPYEHQVSSVLPIEGYPKPYRAAMVDDDWYYEMVALRGFEAHGTDLSVDQLGGLWLKHNCGTWGSSKEALAAMKRGVAPGEAGRPTNNSQWWTIGPMFSCELYGLLAPGDPNLAAKLARRLGRINGHAEGLDGGVFSAGLVSAAFRERDSKAVVRQAAARIHPDSPFRQSVDLAVRLAEEGKSAREVFDAVEDRWHVEYPGTNNAVANGGVLAACVWFAGGDFQKSLDLAASAGDFIDADNVAATACAVVGAMHGAKAVPKHFSSRLNDRIVGESMGGLALAPPVDESISGLAERTAAVGWKVLAANGATFHENGVSIPARPAEAPQVAERFRLADLADYWNKGWKLERAGFGGDGGLKGLRGRTSLAGAVLATFPRDEVRGVVLRRTLAPKEGEVLTFRAGADPGRAWQLQVYLDNTLALDRVVEAAPDAEGVQWESLKVDLSRFQGREVHVRLFQRILLPGRAVGTAYWSDLKVAVP